MPDSDLTYGFPKCPRRDNDNFGAWKAKTGPGNTGSLGHLGAIMTSESRQYTSFDKMKYDDGEEETKSFKTRTPEDTLRRQVKHRLKHFNPHTTLPTHYTQEWMDKSLVQRRLEILDCVEQLSIAASQSNNRPICSIVQFHEKVTTLFNGIDLHQAPLSSVKVQWRVAKCRKVPTLQLIFFMLNRISPVTALTKLNNNSALCVFETINGTLRAVNSWGNQQGSRLLILSWWHPECYTTSCKLKQEKDAALIWLTEKLSCLRKSLEALSGKPHRSKTDALTKGTFYVTTAMTLGGFSAGSTTVYVTSHCPRFDDTRALFINENILSFLSS